MKKGIVKHETFLIQMRIFSQFYTKISDSMKSKVFLTQQ